MSDSEDPIEPVDEDLFGDDNEDEAPSPKERVLEDDDLASDPEGDSYARYRNDDDDQMQHETKDRVVMAVQTYRHRIPKPKDGALRVMRVPKFIKVFPEEYDPETFQPTEFDLANAKSQHPKHVARVRKDHSTEELKSNANIFRWSDGSATISIGGEHYEIQNKSLAPPADKPYEELHDGHYYAAAAELRSNLLMTVGHITEQYNVRPNKAVGDDALSVLAERMAQASKATNDGEMIIRTTRDPELQKRQAEMAEKERMKAQRRRENAAAKVSEGGYGRSSRSGGLSITGLEGGRGSGGRKRTAGSSKPRRRNDDYYDSEEEEREAGGRENDYLEDDFVVGSDVEEKDSGADDDEEEEYEEAPRSKRRRTREVDEDEDAEGDDYDEMETSGRAGRRRNVIDDDED